MFWDPLGPQGGRRGAPGAPWGSQEAHGSPRPGWLLASARDGGGGCSSPTLREVAVAPSEGRARTRGPGEEGGVFRRAGGGFCGDRRATRTERRREKKREKRRAWEKRVGYWRESASGWYRIFQKEGFRWNLYPILPISDFKTVAQDSSPAPNLMRRMALGGRVGSRGGDPGTSVHGTQETSADTFFATHRWATSR